MSRHVDSWVSRAFLYFICLSGSLYSQSRTTWLIMDKTDGYGKMSWKPPPADFYEANKCCWKPIDGFLSGTPRSLKSGDVDYMKNGYWFMVVNTISQSNESKVGTMGSVRFHFNDGNIWYRYFTGCCKPKTPFDRCDRDLKVGVPTIWGGAWSAYDGKTTTKNKAWDGTLSNLAFGPVPSLDGCNNPLQLITPVSFRIRIWITLDKNFVPPTGVNDPVGVQPGGGSTAITSLSKLAELSVPAANGARLIWSDGRNPPSGMALYSLHGERITGTIPKDRVVLLSPVSR